MRSHNWSVRFCIPERTWHKCVATRSAAADVFGIKKETLVDDGLRILCTPGQFGMFILKREEHSINVNSVKMLCPVLIRNHQAPQELDKRHLDEQAHF